MRRPELLLLLGLAAACSPKPEGIVAKVAATVEGTEEYQVEYLAMNHRVFDRFDAVVGEQVWNFADFATTSGVMRVGGNKKGVFTRDRQPKEAAWALRRRWRGGPVVES